MKANKAINILVKFFIFYFMLITLLIIIFFSVFSLINHFISLNYTVCKIDLGNKLAYQLETLYNLGDKNLVFILENMDITNYSKESYQKVIKAQDFVKEENYPSAINLYMEILKEYPRWIKVKEALIEAYFHINHFKNLTKEALELLELEPDNIFALNSLYNVNLKAKKLDLAIRYLNKIIEKTDYSEEKVFDLAELYFENGEFQNSLNTYISISQKNDNIEASKKIFDIFKMQKNLPEELAWCNKILAKEPNNLRFLIEITDIYSQLGQFENALNSAQKLKLITPENSIKIDINIASIYNNLNKSNYAKEILKEILHKDSYNLEARKLLAKIYCENNEFDKMIEESKEVVYSTLKEEELEKSKLFYADILTDYAILLYEQDKNNEALEVLSLAEIEKETDKMNALVAKINYKIKNLDEAASFINRAIEINPNNPEYYYILATVRFEQKRIVESKECYQKAVILNNEYKEAYFGLALAYIQEENFVQSIENFKKCIALNKRDYKAYVNLGIVYEKINDMQNALACYKSSIRLKGNSKISKKIQLIERKLTGG